MQTDDVEVEHLAVQIGNDTDPFRKKLYKQATCYIAPEGNLSPSTIRILQQFLGEVTILTSGRKRNFSASKKEQDLLN